MVLFIGSLILMYLIDVFLVGVTYYSLKSRFGWKLTPKKSFFILFVAFLFLDNYLWPAIANLDISYSVGNETIAKAFNLEPSESVIGLFGFGWFEFVTWSIEALAASYIGERIFREDSMWKNITNS